MCICFCKDCKCGCKDSVNVLLHLLGIIWLIYGLWIHSWGWIAAGIVACALGHLQLYLRKKGKAVEKQPVKPARAIKKRR